MPDQQDARQIEALVASMRVLQRENDRLAEQAEDVLLLGLIAEEIATAQTPLQVLDRGLERISMLKDIPYCACYHRAADDPRLVAWFYQYGRGGSGPVTRGLPVVCASETEAVHLSGEQCEVLDFGLPAPSGRFEPREVLLVPVGGLGGGGALFVFANDGPEERLPGLVVMLHRVIDMMEGKIDNLGLVASLQELLEELRDTNTALSQATKAKSDFLANMSHEIRTPMNAILGFAQLMRRDPTLSEEQAERPDIINRNGEFLLTLINDILEMSKIEAGRTAAHIEPFDLVGMLHDLEAVFGARAEEKELKLTFEINKRVPRSVATDRAKLRQILTNLLSNALKFTEQGRISVRVSAVESGTEVSGLRFEVEDSGVGVAAEELHLLFDHFEQTQSGRSSGVGTGLGLAISREYAVLLGGEISVESQIGVGSRFVLEIEVEPGDAFVPVASSPQQVEALAPEQPTYRVLVADDYKEMRDLVVQMLTGLGFEVRSAVNGMEAVTLFEEWRPDLVLMDMRMPKLSGAEAIRKIRSTEAGKDARIIALTASAFEDSRNELLSVGADDFIGKPFTEPQLLEALGRLLGAEYIYRGDHPRTAGASGGPDDWVAIVASLDPQLVAELRDAAVRADFDRLNALTTRVDTESPVLADKLRALATEYDAAGISALLAETNGD